MSKINIKDENKDHKYFSILQNILSHLKLNAFERSLYWAIKEACGEFGECTKSHETLCEISGMKVTKLKETILSLSCINPILKKPLILVTHRTTIEGIKIPNKIVLTDLWEDNIRFFKEKFNQSPRDYRESPHDPGYSRSATEGGSPRDYKQEPIKKNPLNKTTNDAVAFFECLKNDQRINDVDRQALMKYPEETVILAIQYSLDTPAKKSLMAQLVWFCTTKNKPQVITTQSLNENKEIAKKLETMHHAYRFEALKDSLLISKGGSGESIEVKYKLSRDEFVNEIKRTAKIKDLK